jgi:hypothetical protein
VVGICAQVSGVQVSVWGGCVHVSCVSKVGATLAQTSEEGEASPDTGKMIATSTLGSASGLHRCTPIQSGCHLLFSGGHSRYSCIPHCSFLIASVPRSRFILEMV